MVPENYDFGGISGGPLITIIETDLLRTWALGGVVIEGPHASLNEAEAIQGFEVIAARPAHFILEDGTLDVDRWEILNIFRRK